MLLFYNKKENWSLVGSLLVLELNFVLEFIYIQNKNWVIYIYGGMRKVEKKEIDDKRCGDICWEEFCMLMQF